MKLLSNRFPGTFSLLAIDLGWLTSEHPWDMSSCSSFSSVLTVSAKLSQETWHWSVTQARRVAPLALSSLMNVKRTKRSAIVHSN